MGKLDGKVAIITGATSGIGEGCAKKLAEEGATVVLAGRNELRGEIVQKAIVATGGTAKFIYCDTSKEESIIAFIKAVINVYRRIDILINNAGIFFTGPLEDLKSEHWDKMYDVNVKGCFLMSKYTIPYLISTKGVILNNASVAGMQSYASGRSYAYSSTKAAVVQFTRVLALNYGKDVRVNCICPGIIQTPIFEGRDVSASASKIPIGRVGTPEDVAKVVLFLVSDDAAYLNGVVIPVDGGLSL
ncbi:MAG TPA: SDR family NAD(P)-dependent oxidoreductase [Desulfosporosinus sp.]|nr:SDR family NAD(P)-dependent oxidoreductase [Desulfosporosinus sp.]